MLYNLNLKAIISVLLILSLNVIAEFNIKSDSAREIRSKINLVNQKTSDISGKMDIKQQKQEVLLNPGELFDDSYSKKRFSYNHRGTGKYVLKKDFNNVVDSLTAEFKYIVDDLYSNINKLATINDNLADQNKKQNDRLDMFLKFITSGGFASFVTALTGFILIFKRKRK